MKRAVVFAVSAWMLITAALFADPLDLDFLVEPQANPETIGTPRDPGSRVTEMKVLQERLAAGRVEKAASRPLVIQLTPAERSRIDDARRADPQRYLVGIAKPVGTVLDLAPARALGKSMADLSLGSAQGTGGAGFVWTAEVRVPGATALRLHLTGVDLPSGAELYVYNLAGQAFGPYTGRGPLGNGDLYTNTVFGERLVVQLQSSSASERAPRLTLEEVGVMGARFAAPRYKPEGVFDAGDLGALAKASSLCGLNADCVVNAACQSGPAVDVAKDAVAGMLFQSGDSFFICTGALVADTNPDTVIPYFLTAHHCIGSAEEAASLETYFDYRTACSSPNCRRVYGIGADTLGATLLATSSNSDFTLLQLSSVPETDDGVVSFLGWLSTPVANKNKTALYRISHPQGSPQAYSEQVVDTKKTTCRTLPRGNFIYSRDTLGATEGGSSGSPVVNGAGQVVGQLLGACGINLEDVCDAAHNATVDGAFAATYPSVAQFLNPGSCRASGASCTKNNQCCSKSCKKKGGVKTCS